ncbi:MAG: hypothetical protein OXT67_05330 [Zetaproteobacteria bacterium]|nr:hypothetical protein [Zetaproteobacteria bacterium]
MKTPPRANTEPFTDLPPLDQMDMKKVNPTPSCSPQALRQGSYKMGWLPILLVICTGFCTGLLFAYLLYDDYLELSSKSIRTFFDTFQQF